MVNIAIVGAGFIGKVHSESYKKIDDANVVAIIDKEESNGIKLANDHCANYYSDISECFKKEEIDNVDIYVPTFLHADLVKKAANTGKNVFCEKPIALTLKEACQMINVIEKNKVKGMVGHVVRFWPEYIKVRELIKSEQLGKPLYVYCE